MQMINAIIPARQAAQSLAAAAYATRTTAPATSAEIWDQAMGLLRCAMTAAALVNAAEGAR